MGISPKDESNSRIKHLIYYKNKIMEQGFYVRDDIAPKMKEAIRLVLAEQLDDLRVKFEQL